MATMKQIKPVSQCCLIKLLPYILFEKYIYILALEMASPENQHCANRLSFAIIVMPLPDCTVNQSLIKTVPLLLDALPQFFHVLDLVLVNAVSHSFPHCTADGVYIGTVGSLREGGMKFWRHLLQQIDGLRA